MTAIIPAGPQLSTKYTLTGPDGTVATFNDSTDANFVGYITEVTGLDSPEVRENAENISGQDGGLHGDFFFGRRPVTLAGSIINVVSNEDRNKKITKLTQASMALRGDATLSWTPEGGEALAIKVRRQNPLRISGGFAKDFQLSLVAADPRIYSVANSAPEASFTPSEVLKAEGNGGEGFAATPDGKHLYLANKTSNTVSVFSRNAETGKLTFVETKATGTGPYGVAISPDGKHVYVTNRTAGTVSKFSRNEATGKLTAVGAALATGTEPCKPTFSASGKWLYVPNLASNTISVLERNTSTGELTSKENFSTGASSGPVAVALAEVAGTIAVSCRTANKVKIFQRTEATGKITIEAGLTEAEYSATFSAVELMDIKVQGDVAYVNPYTGKNESYAYFHVLGENTIYNLEVQTGGVYATHPCKVQATTIYGNTDTGGKNRWFVSDSKRNYRYIVEAGLGTLFAFANPLFEPISRTVIGATSNVPGVPVIVEDKHIYVPAENKVFEYKVSGANLVQMFQNKASGTNATNNGSMETYPILTIITGEGQEIKGPIISNNTFGASIFLSLTIPANSVLVINTQNRTVTLNGVNVFSAVNLVTTQWWTILPGLNEIIVSAEKVVGTPKIQVSFNSAWA